MVKKYILVNFILLSTIVLSGQSINGSIEHDGVTRDYILHLPNDYDSSVSYPFVYNLHGFGSNAVQQQFYSAMDITADNNGFIVCYPNGLDNSWNVGWNFGSNADDVGFLLNLVDSLAVGYNINMDRLYSCGMSNGGFMSYRLACEKSDRFAAVASVTGSMVPGELDICAPTNKIPIMQIHGTSDPTVNYNGSVIGASIDDVVNFWAERNSCDLMPDTIQIEDIDMSDQCTAERIQYVGCDEDTQVVFYKIDGGEHTWPDAALDIGVTNRDFNANQEIWNFFNQFDLNGSIVSNTYNIEESKISLYPNPVSNQIKLSNLPIGKNVIKLYNAIGENLLVQNSSNSDQLEIDVTNLKTGIYFLIVEGESSIQTLNFIK